MQIEAKREREIDWWREKKIGIERKAERERETKKYERQRERDGETLKAEREMEKHETREI